MPDEAEQSRLRIMRAMRDQGVSYGKIADALNAEGVPARREGSKWHPQTVQRALDRAQDA